MISSFMNHLLSFITGVVLHLDIGHSLRKGKTVGDGGESTFLPVIVIGCVHENVKNTSHLIQFDVFFKKHIPFLRGFLHLTDRLVRKQQKREGKMEEEETRTGTADPSSVLDPETKRPRGEEEETEENEEEEEEGTAAYLRTTGMRALEAAVAQCLTLPAHHVPKCVAVEVENQDDAEGLKFGGDGQQCVCAVQEVIRIKLSSWKMTLCSMPVILGTSSPTRSVRRP